MTAICIDNSFNSAYFSVVYPPERRGVNQFLLSMDGAQIRYWFLIYREAPGTTLYIRNLTIYNKKLIADTFLKMCYVMIHANKWSRL